MRVSKLIPLGGIIGALIFSASLIRLKASNLSSTEQEQPSVLSASAPITYPPVARVVGKAEGDVIVEAKIDAQGNVISTSVISGHNFLRDVSEKAAKHWKFSPINDRTKIRAARLTFAYIKVGDIDDSLENNEVRMVFVPPYRVEIRYKPNYIY